MDQSDLGSILAIDCGSTTTRALLIGRVEGEFRLISRGEAPSTLESPWRDAMTSVRQALRQITEVTGWHLLDGQGSIIRPEQEQRGVDAAVVMTSASRPLRLVLAGIADEVSLSSARRALPTSYAMIEGLISSDRRGGHVLSDDILRQACLFQEVTPDAIVLVGGVDGGASKPVLQTARAMAWAFSELAALHNSRPVIVYAGNKELQQRVARALGPEIQLQVAENVRPSMEQENLGSLQAAIEELYRQHARDRLPGLDQLTTGNSAPILPTARAFGHTVRYLAVLRGTNVLGVDVGGSTTTAATMVDGHFDLTLCSDLGLGRHAARILDYVPVESVLRWLPFGMQEAEVYDMLHNKAHRYHTVPQTRQELFLEQAVLREILRVSLAKLSSRGSKAGSQPEDRLSSTFPLIVGGGGGLANTPNQGQAALILLDALQPVGISALAVDRVGLMASLGAVAMLSPLAAAQLVDGGGLSKLGTVVAPVGIAHEGEVALTVKLEYEDGRSLTAEVISGSLEVIPLPAGQMVTLELRPTRRFDVGLGMKGQPVRTRVEGGAVGIIVDARGRPLPMAPEPKEQQRRVQRWLQALGS